MSGPISPYRTMIEKNVENTYNVRDEYKHSTVEEIQADCARHARDFAVMALNVEGDLNVAMMIRTASLMGAKEFLVFGRKKFDNRAMVGADKYIPVTKISGLLKDGVTLDKTAFHEYLRTSGYFPVFVEQGGFNLNHVVWEYCEWEGYSPLFIFGNEGTGIPKDFIDEVRDKIVVSIPQLGALRSFNVGATCSIVLWDYVKAMYL